MQIPPIPGAQELTLPDTAPRIARLALRPVIIPEGNGPAIFHHCLVDVTPVCKTAHKHPSEFVFSKPGAYCISRSHHLAEISGCITSAWPFDAALCAGLPVFRRINSLKPEPNRTGLQTISIQHPKWSGILVFPDPAKPGGNQGDYQHKRGCGKIVGQFSNSATQGVPNPLHMAFLTVTQSTCQ